MKKDARLVELVGLAATMIQGSVSETTRTCGREGCRCQRGERHGPHTYLTFRTAEGRSTSRYVPEAERGRVAAGVAAWQRFWELASELAAENRAAISPGTAKTGRGVRGAR